MRALSAAEMELLHDSRRAVLATITPAGSARLVPMAYAAAIGGDSVVLYSALDEKPKTVADPRDLARVRDVVARPRVTVLVDLWNEDWSALRWLRLEGNARLLEPTDDGAAEHALAVGLLRLRYPQYADQALEQRPMLRFVIDRAVGWSAVGDVDG